MIVVGGLLSWMVEVENDSSPGTSSGTELSHLLFEVQLILGWEILEDLSEGGHLSDEYKHVFAHVLSKGSNIACSCGLGISWLLSAERHDIEGWLLEVANGQVLHDLGHLSEHVHILLNVNSVTDYGHWVGHDVLESDDI